MQMKTYQNTGNPSSPVVPGLYYPLQDLLYRTTATINSSASIVEAYDTDAYGNTLVYSGPGADSTWFTDDDMQSVQPACESIFTGREYDPETTIYFYRMRYYLPALGRFSGKDLIWALNLFEYALGRSPVAVDPVGLDSVPFPLSPGQLAAAGALAAIQDAIALLQALLAAVGWLNIAAAAAIIAGILCLRNILNVCEPALVQCRARARLFGGICGPSGCDTEGGFRDPQNGPGQCASLYTAEFEAECEARALKCRLTCGLAGFGMPENNCSPSPCGALCDGPVACAETPASA